MIQIYDINNTDYKQNGDMTLFPESATVHAIINGTWSATLEHPKDIEGRWKYIKDGAVVKMPSFNGEQLFRIVHKEKSFSGISADLQPIFLDAADDCFLIDVRPTEKDGQQALDLMTASNNKYKVTSNILGSSTAYYEDKNLIQALNGNDENAFINRWGGEIIYDNYKAIINERAGSDKGVEILYGKNVQDNGMKEEVDMRNIITRIVPKGYNGCAIEGEAPWVDSPLIDKYPTIKYGVMTFDNVKMRTDAQDEDNDVIICDTQEQLKDALTKRCKEQFDAGVDKPSVTISVDMLNIENTELYADVKGLAEVSLGDTVHCRNSTLDIVTDARVTELEWDCVKNQIASVKLGDYQFDLLCNQNSINNRIESAIRADGTIVAQQVSGIINAAKAQLHAMRDIAKKQDVRAMLFEDLDPESPTFGAMCLGTMGFEIASKRTTDGKDWDWSTFGTGQGFFADYIVAGTMLADRILGGTLRIGGLNNEDGIITVTNLAGKEIAKIDADGVICFGKNYNKRVQLTEGMIKFSENDGTNAVCIDYVGGQTKGLSVTKDGKTVMTIMDNAVSINTPLFLGGFTGKSGKATFSDDSYLEFKNGMLIGGKTASGENI